MGRQYFGKLSIPRGRWVYPTPRDRPEHHSALVASAQSMLSTTQRRRSRSPVVLVSLLRSVRSSRLRHSRRTCFTQGHAVGYRNPARRQRRTAGRRGRFGVDLPGEGSLHEAVGAHAGSGSDRRAQAGPRHRRLGGQQPVRRTGDGTKTLVLPDAKTFNDASPSLNSARRLETRPKAKTWRAQPRPTSTSSSTPASSSWRDPASRG